MGAPWVRHAYRVVDGLATHQALGAVHGDGAHGVVAQVLRDLEHEARRVALHLEGVEDGGQAAGRERHVDHGANDALDLATGRGAREPLGESLSRYCAEEHEEKL